jgi:hypothetical protein
VSQTSSWNLAFGHVPCGAVESSFGVSNAKQKDNEQNEHLDTIDEDRENHTLRDSSLGVLHFVAHMNDSVESYVKSA